MKQDIVSPADINALVTAFYQKVLPDPIIGFIFTDIAGIDLQQHLPKIAGFWHKILLPQSTEGQSYNGRTFEIHQQLHRLCALNEHHFQRWVMLFTRSVDELYSGPMAELAKQRAAAIAESMHKGLHHQAATQHMLQREHSGVQFFDPDQIL
ncbi:group III truncated hemoglobin [Dasania marina]|uniref:group III truncated hemoglobin n=1 Tax=Dasania marina TaxID=471499 RepID=UPI0030DB87C8|tara:strand:- start:83735 stop:84190 length:456 start_codon:yes stop_codon:yes gene_type:complete